MTTAISTQDTIRTTLAEAFPFSVDKFPLFGPDNIHTPHYGLFRSDTAENIGNAVKKGYQPHTLDDVATLAEAALSGFDTTTTEPVIRCHWQAGHNVIIAPSDNHRQAIYGSQDNIFPRFIVRAGYGGTCFGASLGLYRDCCRNLAMLKTAGESVSVKIRHTHSLRPRLSDLVCTFQRLASKWQGVVETARRLEATEIDLREFIRTVYPQTQSTSRRSQTIDSNRANAIARRISRERQATGRPNATISRVTAWEAYNGVQGYVQHEATRKNRPSAISRAMSAMADPAVSRAMQHALTLAS